jgi:hypothetical protein
MPYACYSPFRAIAFAERFLTSNPPCLKQAGRWFHTGKSNISNFVLDRKVSLCSSMIIIKLFLGTALVFLEVLKAGARKEFTDGQ